MKSLNNFVRSAVITKRERETGTQILVLWQRQQSQKQTFLMVTKLWIGVDIQQQKISVEKSHGAINEKVFKRLGFIYERLYQVELVKSEIEYKEPITVGFFTLRYEKVRMLECIRTSLTSIMTLQTSKSLIWIDNRSIKHYPSRICMIVFHQQ